MKPSSCNRTTRAPAGRQRGGAALIFTLALFFVMTLVAGIANRNQLFEMRASSNQVRAAQAFEAAEAGVDWAMAMLNGMQPLDAHCAPAPGRGVPFRERFLAVDTATGAQSPVTWARGSASVAQQAACVREGSGWSCSCPPGAPPALPALPDLAPSFIVHFEPGPTPGTLRLLSTGCSAPAGDCAPGSGTVVDATARVELTLGLLPGLAQWPAAALTARGGVDAGQAAIGFHNPDPASGGIALHAGGMVRAPQARLTGAPGASPSQTVVDGDAKLASTDAEQLFATLFGLAKPLWREQAAVAHVACDGECGPALSRALGHGTARRMVWISGSPQFSAPLTIGTPERPVIVASSGTMRLVGPVQVHGVLHAAALEWADDGSGGTPLLRGAAVSEGDFRGDAPANLFRDAAVLERLKAGAGSFARVPGSWKDF
jgi:hypothetical protein